MKPIPFEPGRIVLSKQGRDQGRLFVVMQVVDDQHVLMANGASRKAENPKRKKIKHLHAKPHLAKDIAAVLLKGETPMNSELRKALADEANV